MTQEELIRRNEEAFKVEWADFDPKNVHANDELLKLYCEDWFNRGIRIGIERHVAIFRGDLSQ